MLMIWDDGYEISRCHIIMCWKIGRQLLDDDVKITGVSFRAVHVEKGGSRMMMLKFLGCPLVPYDIDKRRMAAAVRW